MFQTPFFLVSQTEKRSLQFVCLEAAVGAHKCLRERIYITERLTVSRGTDICEIFRDF